MLSNINITARLLQGKVCHIDCEALLVSVYTRRVTGRRHVFIEYNKVVQAGNNIVHCTAQSRSSRSLYSMKNKK